MLVEGCMKRTCLYGRGNLAVVVAAAAMAAAGCNRAEAPAAGTQAAAESSRPADTPAATTAGGPELRVTGCLTAGLDGRGFALTPTDTRPTEAGQAMQIPGRDTITYELVGNAADFQGHANTIVTAVGREDPSVARDTGVEHEAESEQRPMTGSSDTPTVETKDEVEVNVKRLHVSSVLATGDACPSLGATDKPSTEPPSSSPRPR